MAYVKYSDRTDEQRRAFRRSTDNYAKNAYDQVNFRVPKGTKSLIKEAADAAGMGQNDFLRAAVVEKMMELGFHEEAAALDTSAAACARNVGNLNSMLDQLLNSQPVDADFLIRRIRQTVGIMDNLNQSVDVESGKILLDKLEALPDDVITNKGELAQKIGNLIGLVEE